jgi:hypothetical protein
MGKSSKLQALSEMPKEPKQSRIEKVGNGFVVSSGYGDKSMIAKTLGEAQKIQANFLK